MSNPVPHGWVGSDLENPERAAAWLRELESVTATIAYGGSISAPVGGDLVFSTAESGSLVERGRIAADGQITGIAAADDVPSLSELVAGVIRTVNITVTDSVPCFVAPFACKVVAASIGVWGSSLAASDTDYYTISVRRNRANTPAIVATKTTKTTGGAAIAQRTDYNFDAATFDATNQILQKGDFVDFAFTPTGAPSALTNPILLQIRYEPS